MKKVKKEESQKLEIKNIVESFYLYKGKSRMVKIKGSFFGGGFNLSQNKVKAVFENKELLQNFVNGDFDKDIDELQEDEILEV